MWRPVTREHTYRALVTRSTDPSEVPFGIRNVYLDYGVSSTVGGDVDVEIRCRGYGVVLYPPR